MLQIKRAGPSTLTTPDLERTIDYFTRIVGLSVAAKEKNRAILATKSGLESIVLEHGIAGEAPRLSFQTTPGSDPGEVIAKLKQLGVKSEKRSDITPGIKEAVAFTDPKGTVIELFSDFSFAPKDDNFNGVMPLKLGHIAYTCPDIQGIVKFYCDVLGFRVSDWRGDFFAFLRCSRDHHTVNFLRDAKTGIHHIAFEVRDWTDIKRASRLPGAEQYPPDLGPAAPHHRPQYRDLSQEPGRRGRRVLLRDGPDVRRGARLLRAAALAPGPAAASEGLGRRHAVELVGADVAQPEPHLSGAHRHRRAGEKAGSGRRRQGPCRQEDGEAGKIAAEAALVARRLRKNAGRLTTGRRLQAWKPDEIALNEQPSSDLRMTAIASAKRLAGHTNWGIVQR